MLAKKSALETEVLNPTNDPKLLQIALDRTRGVSPSRSDVEVSTHARSRSGHLLGVRRFSEGLSLDDCIARKSRTQYENIVLSSGHAWFLN